MTPLSRWMAPPRGYPARLAPMFQFLLRNGLMRGTVDTVAFDRDTAFDEKAATSTTAGIAIWTRPGQWKVPTASMLRGMGLIARSGGVRLPRMLGRLAALEKEHPPLPEHWYLEVLGVVPELQGRGLGSVLLRRRLAQLDAEQLPAYLESSNSRNLTLYERHGFVVTKELLFRHGPPQWLLWRDPQPASASTNRPL